MATTTAIRKLFEDYSVHYGDGGEADLFYPVYSYEEGLPVPKDVRERLVRQLRAVGGLRNDLQPNGIVCDIVDPSLHSKLLTKDEQNLEVQQLDERNEALALRGVDFRDGEDKPVDPYQTEGYVGGKEAHDKVKDKRGRFQWVPALVRCKKENSTVWDACLQSSIAGVPERRICPQFYKDMDRVLSGMLPLFDKLDLLTAEEGESKELQIVTKVQEYVLPPKSKYTGRWHTEGYSERIVAAGVYYLDVSTETTGGDLLFRPPETPGPGYDTLCEYTLRHPDHTQEVVPFAGEMTTENDVHPDDVDIGISEAYDRYLAWLRTDRDHSSQVEVGGGGRALLSATSMKEFLQTLEQQGQGNLTLDEVENAFNELQSTAQEKEWHQREHLAAVGVFRRFTKSLPVTSGTAVAFANTIPHRFNTIANDTDEPQRRLFINFFVVDPAAPLAQTTANAASSMEIGTILEAKGITEGFLHEKVCAFCGGYSVNDLLHRKVVRDQARAAMSSGRQHWKTQYFGNAGQLEFYPDAHFPQHFATPIVNNLSRNYEHSAATADLGSGL